MQEVTNLLWSINDRLGGGEGAAFEPPTLAWLNDVIRADRFIAREIQQAGEKRAQELRKQAVQQQRNKGRRR